jgi:hypothetical protein
MHTRAIVTQGFRREDGLWDIEGSLIDTKAYAFPNSWRGRIEPGVPIHEMLVRLTVDDSLTVVAIECATDHSPYAICNAIMPNFQRLVGERIGPGWRRRVRALVGGAEGCAHHFELLCLLATVAFQTTVPLRQRPENAAAGAGFLINSCHVWREDGELAKEFATRPEVANA